MTSEDGKPGFFSRMRQVISSTVNDAVDSMTDPGQELALMLDDLAAEIKQAEADHKQAIIERKVMERKIGELAKQEQAWTVRAEQAVKLGDDTLARAALQRKVELAQEKREMELALAEQTRLVTDMGEQITASKKRLQSLNLRRGTLMAQARAAKQGHSSAAAVGVAQTSRIDAIEDKIAALEAFNEVQAETDGGAAEAARIDAELRKLEGTSELDDQLAALKAKVAAQTPKALERGKGS